MNEAQYIRSDNEMCGFCGNEEERKWAGGQARVLASRLGVMASAYEELASGQIKPHSREWESKKHLAAKIIRELVDDWV
jgi:hypothetical protein